MFFIDFVYNFKTRIKFVYQRLFLLKDVLLLSMLLLEKTVLFSHYALL